MELGLNIFPIFAVILFGVLGKRFGLFPEKFVFAANRLVFYVAIPCLIFLAMIKSPASLEGMAWAVVSACLALVVTWLAALWAGSMLFGRGKRSQVRASFIHCATHGNVAIMGLALAYFGLGDAGLFSATIIAAAVIPVQNVLAVVALAMFGRSEGLARGARRAAVGIVTNPIILATLAGYFALATGIAVPEIIKSFLKMLADMAIPLALVIIGANLSFAREAWEKVPLAAGFAVKLAVLPGLGVLMGWAAGLPATALGATAMILGAPSALISPIMAREMGGDPQYASRMVTVTTLACAFTSYLWLRLLA